VSHNPRPGTNRRLAAATLLLAVLLVLAQARGLMHQVLHGHGNEWSPVQGDHRLDDERRAGVDHDHDHDHEAHAHGGDDVSLGWMDRVVGHAAETDCRLVDQGGLSALPTLPLTLALPAFLPPLLATVYQAPAPPWRCALIQARGPPSFR
jgi:hypothetical protein